MSDIIDRIKKLPCHMKVLIVKGTDHFELLCYVVREKPPASETGPDLEQVVSDMEERLGQDT